jgi:hypothetical protein
MRWERQRTDGNLTNKSKNAQPETKIKARMRLKEPIRIQTQTQNQTKNLNLILAKPKLTNSFKTKEKHNYHKTTSQKKTNHKRNQITKSLNKLS